MPAQLLELALAGPRGEPVDLWRTIMSHGVADLPPGRVDADARTYETTIRVGGVRPRTVRIAEGGAGTAAVQVLGPALAQGRHEALLAGVRRILNLDEDLSGFYAVAAADPQLVWAVLGAGRMVRSATVFEDVVKTVCTTNTTWSGTRRMVGALVEHLGDESAGRHGRTFPSAAAMAETPESFYRDVARAGYRGAYLRSLAASIAEGRVDLEELREAPPDDLPDDEVEGRLLALPGVGPYAAAHVMMLLGRHSRLILDSWTRPKYARVNGGVAATDAEIVARFQPYGRFAGLAFWLFLTRDWVADG